MGSQLVNTLPVCESESATHVLRWEDRNRVSDIPTVGQTVNASPLVGGWHPLAPPKRASPRTLWLAHSVASPCGPTLGLSLIGSGLQFCTVTERHRLDLHQLGNVPSIHTTTANWE